MDITHIPPKEPPVIKTREELLGSLPEYMTKPDCRRWLLWCSISQGNEKKPRKVPHYANGHARGKTDTPNDLNQLVNFDEAYAALATGRFTGLGFALGADGEGGYWQGIDLDNLIAHPNFCTLKPPGYAELSPSTNGLHFIGYGKKFVALGDNKTGIEAYSYGRFLTVTGTALNELWGLEVPEQAVCLADYVEQTLQPMHGTTARPKKNSQKASVIITDKLLEHLESALKFISADEGKTWIAMGYALHELGDAGYKLWAEWSASSDNHMGDADLARWNGLNADRTGYAAVFARAQANGWVNPCSTLRDPKTVGFGNGQLPSNIILTSRFPLVNQFTHHPESLPDPRPDVMAFHREMLPKEIRDYVFDIAARQQSQPDFVAVAAIVGLSGLLGRKALICPKQLDDWSVTPNQWGAIIGRPSAMKSPSMKEALKPLQQIEANASKHHKNEIKRFDAEQSLMKLEKLDINKLAKAKSKSGNREEALRLLENSDASLPTRNRLIVNDATIEKLGELLNENPNGLLLVRDELSGWLTKLAKEEFQSDRAFYLECFDGNGSYTYDRIGRGTIEIQNCTLSIVGGIQPTKIATLVRDAMTGVADDGLIQRFQLVTWPNDIGKWEWIDRSPDREARTAYYTAFDTVHNLVFDTTDGEPPRFRFTHEAQLLFIKWMEEIQAKARGDEIHPALESHMLKMPQTIAGLALLFEIIDGGREVVGFEATKRALMWAEYLLSHANRLYSIATNQSIDNARLILNRKNKLSNPFTARDIERKNWTGLNKKVAIIEALDCLIEYKYLISKQLPTTFQGGSPSTTYQWEESANYN